MIFKKMKVIMKKTSLNKLWVDSHILLNRMLLRGFCASFLLAFAAVCGLSSCSEKVEDNPSVPTNGFIGFTVSDGSGISYITDEEKNISASSRTPIQTASAKSSDGIEFFLEETTLDEFCTETPDSDGLMEYEKALTRGAQVESVSAMGDFSDFAYYADGTPFDEIQNLRVGTDGRTNVRWPGLTDDRKPLRFYAAHPYNAGTFTPSATEFKCAFTVNTTVAKQADLMYASTGVVNYNDQSTVFLVPMHFHHALAAVKVKVGAIGNYVKSINSVTFKGVCTTGTYTLPVSDAVQTGSTGWSDDLGGKTDLSISSLNLTSWTSGTDITDGANTFLMIPQGLDDITLEVGVTSADNTEETISFPLSGGNAWQQGRTRVYTITTSKTMTVKYPESWTNADGGAAVQGPVTQYDANESFGLFAVDPATGKVMLSNIPVSNKDWGTQSGIILEDGHVYSAKYDYYLYYPRRTNLGSSIPAVNTVVTANTADAFFADLIANWEVSTTQNTLATFRAQDLQIAKLNKATNIFQMEHEMGLTELVLGSKAFNNRLVWTFSTADATEPQSRSIDTSVTCTASSSFDTETAERLYQTGRYWTIVKATAASDNTSVTLASVENTRTFDYTTLANNSYISSTSEANDGWTQDVTGIGYGKYKIITVYPTHVPTAFVANFNYSGGVNTITLPRPTGATFTLEVYGAEGGKWTSGKPGKGGYTYGDYTATNSRELFVCVGGKGVNCTTGNYTNKSSTGGYNGGGSGQMGGGGATHIALTDRGVLSNYKDYQEEVLIVAGGGGGADHSNTAKRTGTGGYGGGGNNNGGSGKYSGTGGVKSGKCGSGGTQTACGDKGTKGDFGLGGNNVVIQNRDGGPGGGGGWWGGNASTIIINNGGGNGASGGGSGHITTGTGKIISPYGGTNGNRSGDGEAKITYVSN